MIPPTSPQANPRTDRRAGRRSALARAGVAALAASLSAAGLGAAATPAPEAAASPAPTAPSGADSRETDLGTPIAGNVVAFAQEFGRSPEGRPQAYHVADGQPLYTVEFVVTDMRTGDTTFSTRLPRGNRSKALDYSAADGSVYIGTRQGDLFRHPTGTETIEDLGTPLEDDGIFSLETGDDGTIYGGTYPGGHVFSVDPETGDVRDFGQVAPSETYVQSLVEVDGVVYAGSQPGGRLFRIDPDAGSVDEIALPAGYEDEKAVYRLFAAGGKLFAFLQSTHVLLVYDLATGEWVDEVTEFQGQAVSPIDPATGEHVYFRLKNGEMARYHLGTGEHEEIGWRPRVIPGRFAWVDLDHPDFPGPTLAVTYQGSSRMEVFDVTSGETRRVYADLEGAPPPIHSLGTGPDGKIYIGGYLSQSGMARWDPDTEKVERLRGVRQVEGFGTFGDRLLIGRYPRAVLSVYDTGLPWDEGFDQDPPVYMEHFQDRPHAFADLGDRVAVGTVPQSGRLDGAIGLWDPVSGDLTVDQGVLGNRSPVTLATRGDGLVYGGSTVWGGYGVDPIEESGTLFIYDPDTGEVVYENAPVEGEPSLSGLTFGPDGLLYGLAGGWLFAFDPETREIVRRQQLQDTGVSRYGTDRDIVFDDVGRLFVTTGGFLHRVHPTTWEVDVLAGNHVERLVIDHHGDLYYSRDANLFRYDVAEPRCPEPDQRDTVAVGGEDTTVPNRYADDGCRVSDLLGAPDEFDTHGAWVRHVATVSADLRDDGIISARERATILAAAGEP
ncbi:hypothetical protein CLV30_11661 [Haloactinopolyspora alba]|uniref:Outer membrane protein assembly factor BamB n=1 Tax=Haloactinopolyspora alba TaxID=648780 RepID=A0A2P8DT66_9ACTN|nr:PQQ-binding-like beta-propeller repeat protein [Haloactinopolyspora alba]PSL00401.1 hypothetical protein CLV30_11661 [Haloactinopolyspora alba]